MNKKFAKLPWVALNFSQPIMDNVREAVSGVKGSIVVKLQCVSLHGVQGK